MSIADLLGQRTYRSPYRQVRASVGLSSVAGVLLLGPIYLWRKGAMLEALLLTAVGMGAAALPLLQPIADSELAWGLDANAWLGLLVWLGTALASPALLAQSYRRRGWEEC